MRKSTRSWKERICALLLAAAMVITWMMPNTALTAEAAPGDAGAVYFSVQDPEAEGSNKLLTQDIVIKVFDNTNNEVEKVDKAETSETDQSHENMFKVTGLDSAVEYTYTVEKNGYEYQNAQASRTFQPTVSESNITVGMKMSEIELSANSLSLNVGDSTQVPTVSKPVTESTYTWSVTEGSEYVSVSGNTVTAKAAGTAGDDDDKTASIQVDNGRKKKTVEVTVSKKSFTMGLNVNPGTGKDQNEIALSATGIPIDANGTLTFKAGETEIGTATLPNTAVTYNIAAEIIGEKKFSVEYSGDTKYKSQSVSNSGIYTKTQDLVISGEASKTVTYNDDVQVWNEPFIIKFDSDTIKDREISAQAELTDFGNVPNAVSAADVADITVNKDNTNCDYCRTGQYIL